jgi:uncharacterized protein YlzI (FlbEa/FlbD family)
MIIVTRLHGTSVAVNCDLIERVEVASETVAAVVDKVRDFRASVVKLYLVPSPDPDA